MNSASMLSARPTAAVAGSYLFGSMLGALVPVTILTVAAGLLSPIPGAIRGGLLALGVCALALRSFSMIEFRLPQNSRQIPEFIFSAPPRQAAFRFAFELGTAMRTYVTSEAPYGLALAAALALPHGFGAAVAAAAITAAGFGLGRSQVVVGQVWRSTIITRPSRTTLRAANAIALVGAGAVAAGLLAGQ